MERYMITCHFQYVGIFSMKLYYTLVLGTSEGGREFCDWKGEQ